MQTNRLFFALLAALIVMLGFAPVQAEDSSITSRADCIVDLTIEPLKNFLEYEGSRIKPAQLVRVTFKRQSAESRDSGTYEHLWYHDGKAIGCKRYREIGINDGDVIMVRVKHDPTGFVAAQAKATSNALIRVLTDVAVKANGVSAVIVPREIFDLVIDNLGPYGFYRFEPKPDKPTRSQLALLFLSDPPGLKADVFYFGREQ